MSDSEHRSPFYYEIIKGVYTHTAKENIHVNINKLHKNDNIILQQVRGYKNKISQQYNKWRKIRKKIKKNREGTDVHGCAGTGGGRGCLQRL